MSAPLHPGAEPTNGGNGGTHDATATSGPARRMARDDRSSDPRPDQTHTHPAGSTASADAVEALRRSVTDIKHDVRMLKVVLDKQSIALDRIVSALHELATTEEE